MNSSLTSQAIILSALALGLSVGSISAQQVAEGGGWYAKVQQKSSHHISLPGASISGANDVFISSDINNDGYSDYIAAGIFEEPATGARSARIYVISGLTGEIMFIKENRGPDYGSRLEVIIAGDINSDGFPDILIGAPTASANGRNRCGLAALVSGSTGEIIKIWYGQTAGAEFGASIAGVDDVDRNGFRDVIIGAPGTRLPSQQHVGAAYVFSGSWNGDPNFGQSLYTFTGVDAHSGFGRRVAAADDVNRDGYPDILISAPGYDSTLGRGYPGTVDVFSGLDGSPMAHFQGRRRSQHFGFSIAGVGDIDRDGYPDIAIGHPAFQSDPVLRRGGVIVYSGLTNRVIRHYQSHEMGDGFGIKIAPTGDTNGDFWPDVFIGAPDAEGGRGSATLISGENDAVLFRAVGDDTTSHLGRSLHASGSLNRYGFVDLLILSSSPTLGSIISRYVFIDGLEMPRGDNVSSSAPTRVALKVDMPRDMAGQVYQILVTINGLDPWQTNQGIQIPLADSSLLHRSAQNNLPGFFRGNIGFLDPVGNANATIDFPAGHLSSIVGSSIHFSAIVYDSNGYVEASTVAKELHVNY
ncbi:MAG: FG-GAP-like repeat-containing protein [Planctomycetota bacterium]